MNALAQIKSIKTEISQEAFREKALEKLSQLIQSEFPRWQDQFEQYFSHYQKNESEHRRGFISGNVYHLLFSQTLQKFHEIIDQIVRYENKLLATDLTQLSEYSIYQCGQERSVKAFDVHLQKMEIHNQSLHFYLLFHPSYCASYQIGWLMRYLKESKGPTKFIEFVPPSISTVNLPLESNLTNGQNNFRKAFNRWLSPQVQWLYEFDQKIELHYPQYKGFTYIPLIYSFHFLPSNWLETYHLLEWVMKDFCKGLTRPTRKYIFFFIIVPQAEATTSLGLDGKQDHSDPISLNSSSWLDKLQALERISENVKLLPQMDHINQKELNAWFDQYFGGNPNRNILMQRILNNLGVGEEWDRVLVEKELKEIVHEKLNSDYTF